MVGRRFARSVLFVPNIVAPVVLSILWGFIFRSDGLVNAALARVGITGPNWLGADNLFAMVCVALTWIYTGFYITILMAAVDDIPRTTTRKRAWRAPTRGRSSATSPCR